MTRARNLANLGNKNAITADIGLFNIGIGSTQPHDYKLEVVGGDAYIGGGVTITGNLSVGGTVTYEDVTNVDAVGIITANKGVYIVGGGLTCVGIATFFGDVQTQGDVSIVDTIYHSGDTNTKIRFPAADTFSVETGGSEALRVDSEQKILIGATSELLSQNDKLQIADTSANAGIIVQRAGDNANPPYFNFHKTRSASVGGATIVQSGDELGRIRWNGTNGSGINYAAEIRGYVDGTPGASNDMPGRIAFYTTPDGSGTPAERLRITSAGAVGINRTSPNHTLEVGGNVYITSNTSNANEGGGLLFQAKAGGFNSTSCAAIKGLRTSDTSSYLVFETGGTTERLRITSAGNVGIGSAVPTGKLDIATGGNAYINLGQDSDNPKVVMFRSTGSAPNTHYGAELQLRTGAFVFSNAAGAALGSHSFVERLRITTSGDLLVGTSTSRTINSHVPNLQVTGYDYGDSTVSIINNENNANGAYLFFGKQRSGGPGGSTVVANDDIIGELRFNAADGSDLDNLAARIVVTVDGTPGNNDTPGRMAFYTAPDGSATAVERMRLDQGGNLILGGTSAQAADAVTLRQDGEVTAPGFYFSNNIGSPMNSDGIRRATTNTIVVDTNSAERIRIDATGCVGINTSVTNSRYLTVSTIALSNTVQEANFRTENWEDGTHAAGWSKNGIQIHNSAKTNAGDNVINYIKFNGRAPELNGNHGGNGFITWRSDTGVQGTYGTSRMDIFQRNAAAYSFDGDPAVNPSYWQSSLVTVKSNGNIGIANTNPQSKVEISASASPTIIMSYTNGTKYGAWESATDYNTFYAYNGAGIRFSSHSGTSYACSWYIDEPHQNFVNTAGSPVATGTQNNRSITLPNVGGTSNSYRRFSSINSYLEGSGGITGRVNDGNGARWMSIVPMGYPGTGGGVTSGGGWAINVSTNTYAGYDQTYVNTPSWYFHGAGHLTPAIDDTNDLGSSSFRLDDIYATNSTINTSDENEKQDIAELTTAEKAVAVRLKALMRTYKFKSAVAKKGSSARIHCGTTAQLVKSAFEAESLDVTKYALWCENTWYTDSNGDQVMPTEINGTEYPSGSTKNVKLGIRYSEMFAFIISTL